MAERAQEYAGDAQAALGRTRQRAQNQLERMVNENPLLVSAGALVLGAAVGLAIPETERENEWLGETRDTVVDRAQEMARKTATSVQEAAGDMAGDVVQRVVSGDEK